MTDMIYVVVINTYGKPSIRLSQLRRHNIGAQIYGVVVDRCEVSFLSYTYIVYIFNLHRSLSSYTGSSLLNNWMSSYEDAALDITTLEHNHFVIKNLRCNR